MTQKEKELLLKDLCGRLPYGVIIDSKKYNEAHYRKHYVQRLILVSVLREEVTCIDVDDYPDPKCREHKLEYCKPYLRPMSSMTEDEKKEFIHCAEYEVEESVNGRHYEYYLKDYVGTPEKPICNCNAIDWLNAHHFAEWQKQQMIKNAVDATIFSELKSSDGSLFQTKSDRFRMNGVKISDRIKVIPIKTEQQ